MSDTRFEIRALLADTAVEFENNLSALTDDDMKEIAKKLKAVKRYIQG